MGTGKLTILEGSTFCICDEIGDLDGKTSGLFAEDTRFLSRLELRINGERPLLLSSGRVEYFSAAFFLRNPLAGGLTQDVLAIVRQRFVGEGMQDHVVVQNVGPEPVRFTVELEVGTDFADIISVKAHDFALGDPLHARPLPAPARVRFDDAGTSSCSRRTGAARHARRSSSRSAGETDGSLVRFPVELGPREEWDVRVDVVASLAGDETAPHAVERRFGEERRHVRDSLDAWHLRVPQLRASWDSLGHAFGQSVSDLASLRMRAATGTATASACSLPPGCRGS